MREQDLFYASVALVSFLAVFMLVPLCRKAALKLGALDQPDQERKVHRRAVPYLGGLSFFLAWLLLLIVFAFAAPHRLLPEFYPLAAGGFLIVLLGVYDDICDLTSKIKLPLELLLCASLYFWGFKSEVLSNPFGGTVYIGGFALVVTALWIAGIMNAVNFADGLDGLAAGLTCICSAVLFFVSFRSGSVFSCTIMAFLFGITLAFLCYNFHPASIFMGDAGALFLGFLLGASTVIERQKGTAVIALSVPVMVMAVPLLDTVLSFMRRLRRARSGRFFTPDREHLHHRLLALGLSQKQVVLSLYAVALGAGILAVLFDRVTSGYKMIVLAAVGAAAFCAVALLRLFESRQQWKREKKQ
ncbi:MAG TPA: MraY family glycosyltransferase [Candidatus Hydrogenedentes bacterium]|jgi:UDP-GlcNAc:undecaprenyl-phosphate GlcNAc-1-phosphate transferase|nr:MAG: putative undecaprenyl-phosphate N-acetylglucosaminyl 1-phosphate transferase [Candidatus Hydrogenedentes bacterium ADurb.Bin170]HNZ49687.1 MraY family glycosyltransferase [Candidatus Hydrogenedentota bacterium]HOD96111.1 MraY family glycosyltransferase [Candidatus Hydrogenedentota bacterium]HOH43219.1 MraY family glycosyltransferase [Candidatus Hydrogenedentota bacterium]HOM47092.1 MraY family glycosyltransferase [Candidatus Hydrogenedentota bacterium]